MPAFTSIHLDDVEPPEHFDRLRDGPLERRWIGAVGLDREAFACENAPKYDPAGGHCSARITLKPVMSQFLWGICRFSLRP
jgi:hypothetical protein